MKTVLFLALALCVLQPALASPLQQQQQLQISFDPESDSVQVTESKLEYLPEENEEPASSVRIDDDGLTTAEPVPVEFDETEQEVQNVQSVQKQDFEDVQSVTTPDNSDEDGQSQQRSTEDQSNESWLCSVFGCQKP